MARDLEIVSPGAHATRVGLSVFGALIYVFLFAPIVLLVLFSFNANRYATLPVTAWTLDWYRAAVADYQIHDALLTTLRVAAEVTAISTLVGTATAFPLVRSRLPFRNGIRIAFVLPIMIPGLLIGVSLLVLFTSSLHLQLSPETAVIGQSVYTTPFVILLVSARLQTLDRELERAASDLGANAFARLRFIILPLLLPAMIGGALVAFTLSLDEFIITYFLIGRHDTLPIYIYTQVKFGITPEVNAVATMLLAASLTILGLGFALPQIIRAVQRVGRAALAADSRDTREHASRDKPRLQGSVGRG